MPTPFTHLAAAAEMLAGPALAPELSAALRADLPAFLLGNIAPDVQTVSGQPREATHFFPVPLRGAPPAPQRLFRDHPSLGWRRALLPAQAAFLAGYLAHLVYDQLWIAEIFEPVFGEAQAWGSFRERLYLHNVLRAHWDALDLARLEPGAAATLRGAAPAGWLPFVDDHHLRAWRDLVADQIGPGTARTVEVFAARMRVDPAEFAALLESPEALQRQVLDRIAPGALDAYRERARERSLAAIAAFWQGDLEFRQL
jgi:hypothetical protein